MALVANVDQGRSLAAVAAAVAAASASSAFEGRPTIRLASSISSAVGSHGVAVAPFDCQPNSARIGRSPPLQQGFSPPRAAVRPPHQRPETPPPVVMRRHNASATAPPGMTKASSPPRGSPTAASLSSNGVATRRGRMPAQQRSSSMDQVDAHEGGARTSPCVRSPSFIGAAPSMVSVAPPSQMSLGRSMAPGPARSTPQIQQALSQKCQLGSQDANEERSPSLSRSSPSCYLLHSPSKMSMEKNFSQMQLAQANMQASFRSLASPAPSLASPAPASLQHSPAPRDVGEEFDFQAMTTPRADFHASSSSTPLPPKLVPYSTSPNLRSSSPSAAFQHTSGASAPRRSPQRSHSASMMTSLSSAQRRPMPLAAHSQAEVGDTMTPRRCGRFQAPGFSSPPMVVKDNPELLAKSTSKRNTLPRSFVSTLRKDSNRNDSLMSPRGVAAVLVAKPSIDKGGRQHRPQILPLSSVAAAPSGPITNRNASGHVSCSGGSRTSRIATSAFTSPQTAPASDEKASEQLLRAAEVANRDPNSSASTLRLEIGTCSLQGLKAGNPNWLNQDTSLIFQLRPSLTLAAVFDGHGENGRLISDRVKGLFEQFAETLLLQSGGNIQGGLCQLFALVQSVLEREGMSRLSGTTATIAIIDQAVGSMVTAHAGDSKLMLTRAGEVAFETTDHVVDANAERRVVAYGGEVRELDGSANAGVQRIFMRGQNLPGLAMSRSLGDIEAHNIGALAEPEIGGPMPIQHGDVVILASDGVWDKLPREFVAANVGMSKAEPSAHAMAFAARAGWPPEGDIDDITAVVVQVFAGDECSEFAERTI